MLFSFGWGQAGQSTKLTERSEACACAGVGLAAKPILCKLYNSASLFCAFIQFCYNTVDILVFFIIM